MQVSAEAILTPANIYPATFDSNIVQPLSGSSEAEVLDFLFERPVQTFGMIGAIKDNGLVSPLNRGTFWGCRDSTGKLEGVGLIGHNTIFEARSIRTIRAFAEIASACQSMFLLLGPEEDVERFLGFYTSPESSSMKVTRYLLLNQRSLVESREPLPELRPANLDDLPLVARAHSLCGIEETGVDGLAQDAVGFTERCANRIKRGQTFVLEKDQKLIFKIEVLTRTPPVTYLESLWIDPAFRENGYSLRCISQVSGDLLRDSASICLLVREDNLSARHLYEKAGYTTIGYHLAAFFN
jgi:ribosomal protein S18 acetylase RimI-like enzyme